MYFSRAELNGRLRPADLGRHISGNGYGIHQLVWRLFAANEKQRDFLYREEHFDRGTTFYLVSARQPVDSDGFWSLQSKPYAPRLHVGEKLSFRLRANAVKSKRDGKDGALRRHDVVMDLKTDFSQQFPGRPLPTLPDLVQQAGSQWLVERAAKHGFHVDETTIVAGGYLQHRLAKGRQRLPIRISTVDLSGVLTVIEPELFLRTLYSGIGHARGFGCGLLMVRRL